MNDNEALKYVIDNKFNDAMDGGVLDLDRCWDVLYTQGYEVYCHLKIKDALKVVASPIVVERLIDNSPTYFEGINLEIKDL